MSGLSKITLARAFRAQGVTLKYPARSRSGIRWDDGAVVIAIDAARVRSSADGHRCLLCAPIPEAAADISDPAIAHERREHCLLAARHGGADGRWRGQYWASWGIVARAERRALRPWDEHAAYARAAA